MTRSDQPKHIDGLVRARYRGYANGAIREPGDVFLFTGPLGRWMEEVEPETAAHSDELSLLRKDAADLGVSIDKRWGADRVKAEIEKALAK